MRLALVAVLGVGYLGGQLVLDLEVFRCHGIGAVYPVGEPLVLVGSAFIPGRPSPFEGFDRLYVLGR